MTNENHVVWLRLVDAGTDSECWFVCNRCDPGAIPFIAESEITRPAEVGGGGLEQLLREALEFTECAAAALVGSHPLSDEYKAEFLELGDPLQKKLMAILSPPTPGSEAKS